ncbi:MAG: spermidine synthase [Deltaproteobacteria bacterium]|nr:spermidine synthase [Deltaproteobacteria bacterium]MBW2362844.1 spermidine synthase [Deltaproteobacteria bacterium]
MQPRNIEILADEATDLGPLCLRRRELLSEPGTVVTEITLDHQLLMSSYYTASERALARVALEMHAGEALRVLIGGLGLGYTAHESLRSPRVARAEVVEFLPQVIDWLGRGLVPLAQELNADERLAVVAGDVYRRLAEAPQPGAPGFDLILIDVDHSPDEKLDETSASFYSAPGLRRAKRHLAPGGVFGVWSYAESSPFADALRAVFREVQLEEVTYENAQEGGESSDWLFFARD